MSAKNLSKKQLEAIELLAIGGLTAKNVWSSLDIPESTFFRWRKLPEFNDEVIRRSRELLKEHLPDIYKTLTDNSAQGSHQHIKLVLDHLEKLEEMRWKAKQGEITFTWRAPSKEDPNPDGE